MVEELHGLIFGPVFLGTGQLLSPILCEESPFRVFCARFCVQRGILSSTPRLNWRPQSLNLLL